MNDDIKDIFNKWGTYQSLQKDVALVRYFMKRPGEKIRQKTVIKHFENEMVPKTVRAHLYKLVKKGILIEDPEYKGTYIFSDSGFKDFAVDMDKLFKAIFGEDLYDIAVQIWKEKHQHIHKDLEYDDPRYRH